MLCPNISSNPLYCTPFVKTLLAIRNPPFLHRAATSALGIHPTAFGVSDHRVAAFLGAAWRRRLDFPGFGAGGSPLGRSEAGADRERGQASPGGQILLKIKRRRLEAERNAATPRDQLRKVNWLMPRAPHTTQSAGRPPRPRTAGSVRCPHRPRSA